MKFVPRDFQEAGINLMLEHPGAGLLFAPGSGKTVTALTAANILMLDRFVVERTLVVAPKMVAQEVWHRECAKWAHLRHLQVAHLDASIFEYRRRTSAFAVYQGVEREIIENDMTEEEENFLILADVVVRRHELQPADHRRTKAAILARPELIHVVSRDHFYNLVKILGTDWPYDLTLGDESTMWKNHDSKRTIAMRYLRHEKLADRLVVMSGTPSPRSLENLWAQVNLLDGGVRLGKTLKDFRKAYMVPDARDRSTHRIFSWKARDGATAMVTDRIKDICLAVKAEAWRKTEAPRTVECEITLPDSAMALYRRMEDDYEIEIGDIPITAPQAAVLGGKLLQLASGAVLDADGNWHAVHDAKLDYLEELVEELDGEPLLVLYWFKSSLARLKRRFPKLATTKTKGFLDRFARGGTPILALQPGGAGHGLDGLQEGGHHVAVFDVFHDFELYQQAISRLDRTGQKHQVTVHQLLAAGTKDRQVARVLADREADQARVMHALRFRA